MLYFLLLRGLAPSELASYENWTPGEPVVCMYLDMHVDTCVVEKGKKFYDGVGLGLGCLVSV